MLSQPSPQSVCVCRAGSHASNATTRTHIRRNHRSEPPDQAASRRRSHLKTGKTLSGSNGFPPRQTPAASRSGRFPATRRNAAHCNRSLDSRPVTALRVVPDLIDVRCGSSEASDQHQSSAGSETPCGVRISLCRDLSFAHDDSGSPTAHRGTRRIAFARPRAPRGGSSAEQETASDVNAP